MIGPETTCCGSMAELPQMPRVFSEGAIGCRSERGTDRIVRAALGISGSCDRHGVVAVATLNQLALPGWPVEVWRLMNA